MAVRIYRIFLLASFTWCWNTLGQSLTITQIHPNAFVYTTYNDYNGISFPSNSMYLLTSAGAVLIDTPWDTTQFQPLLDSIRIRHQATVVCCIVTHFHADRTAGLEYYNSLGIPTWSSARTYELCVARGEKKASHIFTNDTTFSFGEFTFETFYPGPGHSPDNIVIWIPQLEILYGGCFVKSVEVNDLGNLEDASQGEWSISIQNVIEKYPTAHFVIPGHFGGTGKNALKHTRKLANKYPKR